VGLLLVGCLGVVGWGGLLGGGGGGVLGGGVKSESKRETRTEFWFFCSQGTPSASILGLHMPNCRACTSE